MGRIDEKLGIGIDVGLHGAASGINLYWKGKDHYLPIRSFTARRRDDGHPVEVAIELDPLSREMALHLGDLILRLQDHGVKMTFEIDDRAAY